jgi:5-formyltetrahydrofolate cyclo-ligase
MSQELDQRIIKVCRRITELNRLRELFEFWEVHDEPSPKEIKQYYRQGYKLRRLREIRAKLLQERGQK